MSVLSSCDADFENLGALPEFAEFASILNKLTGLVMALNSAGSQLRRCVFDDRQQNPICQLVRERPEGLCRCQASDRRHYLSSVRAGRPQLYVCHAGLWDIVVPVFAFGRHVGAISSGQVLRDPVSDEGFVRLRKRIAWLQIPEDELRKAYQRATYLPVEQIRCIIQLLELFARQLCESGQHIRDLQAKLERAEIQKARQFVDEHFRDPSLRLSQVARHACLSPAHFSHVFQQTTGTSLTRFIQVKRITEAKALLAKTEDSITTICFACGFSNLTHFNRVFRSFERQSPSHYRQTVTKELTPKS